MKINRYPGPRSFESYEQAIFKGRSKEIQDLLELIRLEQVMVVFSKSGLGKSSLLNAGIGPALPSFGYQPIRVRFQLFDPKSTSDDQTTDRTPLSVTLKNIVDEYDLAHQQLKSQLVGWKQELYSLPPDDEEQLANQQAALEQLIQEQIESLNDDEELNDEKLAEFKQKQEELTKHPLGQTDQRNALRAKIEAGETALSLTIEKDGKYSPLKTTDPHGQTADGRLWETLKLHPFPGNVVPVFFFDQFEEFFHTPADSQQARQAKKSQQDFLNQLAEVLCDQPPRRVSSPIAHELYPTEVSLRIESSQVRTAELVTWERQLPVKCVFAIRDDRLAEIDSLERFIPLVLKNRYKLNPLNGENARLAIVEPADAVGDFTTPRFCYADEDVPNDESANTLQLIIKGLSNTKGEIDSTQLQMVCNNIETAIEKELEAAKKAKKEPEKIIFYIPEGKQSLRVDKRLIPDEQTIKTFINEFYTTRLSTVGTAADIDMAGRVLENHFVLNKKRIGIDEPVLKEYLGQDGVLIGKLIESRLIRPEPTSRGIAYELSHDKLVEPVEEAKKIRDNKEEEKRRTQAETDQRRRDNYWLAGVGVAFLVAFLASIYYFKMKNEIEGYYAKSVNSTANRLYELGKHNLAYRIWTDDDNLSDTDKADSTRKLNKNLLFAPFAGKEFAYDAQQHYVAVRYKDDSISVFERIKDSTSRIIEDSTYRRVMLPVSTQKPISFDVAGRYMVVVDEKDSVQRLRIIDLPTRRVLFYRNSRGPFNIESVLLSPKGNYILITDTMSIPHLFKLHIKGVDEVCEFNVTGQAKNSEIDFLPNETGCYFFGKQNADKTLSFYVSNFKWDTTFNIIGNRNSLSGRKMLLWTKKGEFRYPFVLDVTNKKIDRLSPMSSFIYQAPFINNDSLLVVEHGLSNPKFGRTANNLSLYILNVNQKSSNLISRIQLTIGNLYKYLSNSEWFIVNSSTDSSHLFIRNINNNILRKIAAPFKKDTYELLGTAQNYLALRTSDDGKIWIVMLTTGKCIQLNTILSDVRKFQLGNILLDDLPPYEFYISPGLCCMAT